MNNGLHGRYQPQMEAWNDARMFAGELVEAFFTAGKTIRSVTRKWSEIRPYFPSPDKLKGIISQHVFSPGRKKIDKLARTIMNFDGWWH